MPQNAAVDKMLAGAKNELSKANAQAATFPKISPSTSSASVNVVPKRIPTTGDELAVKKANVTKYVASLPKMHAGGTVSKDGAYQLKAGEHVLTAKEATRARKHVLISAGLRSMATPTPKAGKAETSARPTESKAVSAVKVRPEKDQAKKVSIKK